MALTCKILYWENDVTVERFFSMGDIIKPGDDVLIPKENVLVVMFSTKVQGQDTRVRYLEKSDNYEVSLNNNTNVASLYDWDDLDGGWYRINDPFANDGYAKEADAAPRLRPYTRSQEFTWIFTGIMLTQQEWDSTQAVRDALV